MDEDENDGNGAGMVPIALAVFGIVLGGAGLYFGMNANQRLSPLDQSIKEDAGRIESLAEQVAGLDARLSETNARLGDLENELGRFRSGERRTENAIGELTEEINTNRDRIRRTAGNLNKLAERLRSNAGARGGQAGEAQSSNGEDEEADNNGETPEAGTGGGPDGETPTYTVKAGDTFAKIARREGVALQALIDANPGVEPRRLNIGQTIRLPENE